MKISEEALRVTNEMNMRNYKIRLAMGENNPYAPADVSAKDVQMMWDTFGYKPNNQEGDK